MFPTLFWLSLNSLNLPEGRDNFQMIQKHPAQCRNFLENKGTVWTIWKISRHSGKFPHNLETFKTLWELSIQYGKYTWNLEILQRTCKLSRNSVNLPDNQEGLQVFWKVSRRYGIFFHTVCKAYRLESFQTSLKVSGQSEKNSEIL